MASVDHRECHEQLDRIDSKVTSGYSYNLIVPDNRAEDITNAK